MPTTAKPASLQAGQPAPAGAAHHASLDAEIMRNGTDLGASDPRKLFDDLKGQLVRVTYRNEDEEDAAGNYMDCIGRVCCTEDRDGSHFRIRIQKPDGNEISLNTEYHVISVVERIALPFRFSPLDHRHSPQSGGEIIASGLPRGVPVNMKLNCEPFTVEGTFQGVASPQVDSQAVVTVRVGEKLLPVTLRSITSLHTAGFNPQQKDDPISLEAFRIPWSN